VAYLRVSTDDQRLGMAAQRDAIAAWAVQGGVTVAAWCPDQGVSGAAPLEARPGLLDALEALRSHRAGVLVVARRDRLARDVAVAAIVERVAAQAGARVVSAAGEGTDAAPQDPAGILVRGMMDLLAQYERALIALRIRAALRAKRARGERAGAVPWGYTADATGRLAPAAGEQHVTARVRELRAAGLSQRAIVARLAAEGVTARGGHPLRLVQVQRRLRDS
jgi:DNA invertase Pin-like site-specific DNA recombinase